MIKTIKYVSYIIKINSIIMSMRNSKNGKYAVNV